MPLSEIEKKLKRVNFTSIIENKVELDFYRDLSMRVVEFLKLNGSCSFDDIIKFVGGSERRTIRLLGEMLDAEVLDRKNDTFFLRDGTLPKNRPVELLCSHCRGTLINVDSKIGRSARKFMAKIYQQKPVPTFLFDQRPVTLNTTVNRALYATWRGDLAGKRIAVIGDDDLTSLAIGYLGVAKEVVVFEIDKRITNFIKKMNSKYLKHRGTRITTVNENIIANRIPKKYQNNFDVFFADPTPQPLPFTAFVNVGIKLLRKKGVGYLSLYPSHSPKTIDFQRNLTAMGLLMTDVIPFFTEYGSIDQLYRPTDRVLFRDFSIRKHDISFFEYMMRVETTETTAVKPVKNVSLEKFLGKATKRILDDPQKDPAMGVPRGVSYLRAQTRYLAKNRHKKFDI